jgi:hypothetical protein
MWLSTLTPSLTAFDSYIYMATDAYLYVTEPERLATEAVDRSVEQMVRFSQTRKKHLSRDAMVLGIIPNKVRKATGAHQVGLDELKERYGQLVWPEIALRTVWAEASLLGQLVYTYAPSSEAANEAWQIVKQTVEGLEAMAVSKSERLKRQREQRGGPAPTALELLDAVIGNAPATIEPRAIALVDDGAVRVGHFVLSPVGMQITAEVTRDEWLGIFTAIQHIQSAIQWIIGDWLVYGVEREWGKTYDDFAAQIGYKPETLHNFAWVAKSIHFSLRNEKLSFNHHYVVAGMSPEDQRTWLERAVENHWSVARLREEITGDPLTR